MFSLLFVLVACDSKQSEQKQNNAATDTVIEKAPEVMPAPTDQAASPEDKAVDQADEVEVKNEQPVAPAVAEVEPAKPMTGEQVYQKSCGLCHGTGSANSPKLGDVAAWKPRIEKGMDALYASVKNGIPGTAMMAKGTCAACSDEELNAAVDFMVSKVK